MNRKFNWWELIAFIVLLVFVFKVSSPDMYIGFYYPDIDDLNKWKQSTELKSLEECRDWVNSQAALYQRDNWDYECGMNCRFDKDWDMYICEETLE